MEKKIIRADTGPAAAGPYSQAVCANGFIFVSGQLPIEPDTGRLVTGDIAKAAEVTITNVKSILEAVGVSLDDVVKTTVYLKDMDDFAQVNEVYAAFFTKDHPARVCVSVEELPKGAGIEMDAIALNIAE